MWRREFAAEVCAPEAGRCEVSIPEFKTECLPMSEFFLLAEFSLCATSDCCGVGLHKCFFF